MKKRDLQKIVLTLFVPLFYFIVVSGFKEKEMIVNMRVSMTDDPNAKSFVNLIFTDTYFGSPLHGHDPNDPRSIENNLTNFRDSLHFNSVHVYGYGNLGGGFNDSLSYYQNYINGLITTVNNAGLRGFYGRDKIEQLSYGQRLIYEVEGGNSGFSYQTRAGNATQDSGRLVIHLVPNTSPSADARWLCKDIYENLQHGDLVNFNQVDSLEWNIKPVIRIKATDYNVNSTLPVVAISTYNYRGNRIDSAIIRVRNFGDGNGDYAGNYIENYSFFGGIDSLQISGSRELPKGLNYGMDDNFPEWKDSCKVDFKVWWFGEIEVWFDKMMLDDRFGDMLLNTDTSISKPNERKIIEEAEAFTNLINSGNGSFFIDELCISQIPNVKRVNELLKATNSNARLNFATTNYLNVRSCKDNSIGHRELLKIQPESFNPDMHELHLIVLPNNLNESEVDPHIADWRFKPPSVFNEYLQKRAFGDKSDETGIEPIEGRWNDFGPSNQGTLVYQINLARRQRDSFAIDTKLIIQPQIQGVLTVNDSGYFDGLKEPLNEEIEAQAAISIAHGADGICWFIYHSTPTNFYSNIFNANSTEFSVLGLQNHDPPNYSHRHRNIYGQDKWNAVRKLNIKIEHWKSTFDKINWESGYSVHKEGSNHNFISDIKSIYRDPQSPFSFVHEDTVKYWEMGFFSPDDLTDKGKYFIMVNRRCVPDINNDGDLRQLKIKFNSSQLLGFKNWKIIDLDSNKVIRTFDKDSNIYVDMKTYQPGEGKLYKLAPVMQEGGTLVADEDCGGFEFDCKGEVNNNGHDITIVPNTTILFANTSARIIMNGGSFHSGSSSESYPIYLKAKSAGSWKGLKLGNCEEVELHQTHFNGVSPYPVDSTYAAEFTDCGSINISNCVFSASSTGKTGSLLITYTSQGDPEGVYIFSNYFNLNTGSMPAVSVIATGYDEVPMLMELNGFESCSENSTLAILLSNVTGGAIKENNFTGYDKTVFMLGSSIDFYGNSIIGSDQSSVGIIQHSASNANLSASGEMFTGGYNSITVDGQTAKCIQLSNSYLLIDEGYNNFKLDDSATGNFHLEGTIPNDLGADPYPAENNCFEIGYAQQVKHNLRWIDETPINLDAVPTNCNTERPENLIVFNLENGINDTIRFESGGSGGGSAIRNYEFRIKNYENSISENLKESVSNVEALYIKALSDSVSINLRKRNYERVSVLCMKMLTDYADSINDASIISKLYLAELKQDTNQIRMSELKTFLESYILNNPEKEMMIRQAFYFVQKCKVSLGLYESAMTGFQQIINQFPYSYEGLLASWDYAATSLLNSQGGSGGGASSKNEPALRDEGVISYIDDPNDFYDSRKFSSEDRKTLNENLSKTFSSQVNKQTLEIKSLEEKLSKNEASNSEKKKYQEMKTLKEIVKTRKPENVSMHVSMISEDLSRIMKSTGGDVSDKYEENILPTEFALHQNYPNPFNPATKISFDLPQDSKVNLVVYDLLGREVKRLVNNEFKVAGRYTFDFNGTSLSSGVYFYRLVVSSSNPLVLNSPARHRDGSNQLEAAKFSETKRMVLLK